MENLLKTARSSMSGHEQAKPEETFETQKTFTSLGSHLSGELLQDFWSQKFLERFEWKMSMEKGRFIFVVHCKTSLGLGFVTLSNDSRRFFALVLYLHRVISKLHGIDGRPPAALAVRPAFGGTKLERLRELPLANSTGRITHPL